MTAPALAETPDRSSLIIVVLAFVAALGGFWAGLKFFGNNPALGSQAPEFSLRDSNGKLVALSDFRGRKVLINFWATWCAPCVEEMPMLSRFAEARSSELVVLGIAEDDPAEVQAFLQRHRVSYPILQAASAQVDLSMQFGNQRAVLPYSVLVDAEGVVQRTREGSFSEGELARFIR